MGPGGRVSPRDPTWQKPSRPRSGTGVKERWTRNTFSFCSRKGTVPSLRWWTFRDTGTEGHGNQVPLHLQRPGSSPPRTGWEPDHQDKLGGPLVRRCESRVPVGTCRDTAGDFGSGVPMDLPRRAPSRRFSGDVSRDQRDLGPDPQDRRCADGPGPDEGRGGSPTPEDRSQE